LSVENPSGTTPDGFFFFWVEGSIRTSIAVLDFGKKWDGTDVSADLSSEALGEGGSLGEGGGRPSQKTRPKEQELSARAF